MSVCFFFVIRSKGNFADGIPCTVGDGLMTLPTAIEDCYPFVNSGLEVVWQNKISLIFLKIILKLETIRFYMIRYCN